MVEVARRAVERPIIPSQSTTGAGSERHVRREVECSHLSSVLKKM